jgi:uncharacterized integral membrane protein
VGDEWTTPAAQPPSEPAPRDRKRETLLVLGGVTLVLFIWFAAANLQDVQIHFWVTTKAAPLIVVVLISGFLGAVASSGWARIRRRRRGASAERAQGRGV